MKPTAPRTVLFIVIIGCIHIDRFTNAEETGTTAVTITIATSSEIVTSIQQKMSTTTPMAATSASSTLPSTSSTTATTTSATTDTSVPSPITSNVVSGTTSFSPREPSGPGWWLLVALVITIALVIVAGVLFYRRQFSPYRRSFSCSQWYRQCNFRFLHNWRSNDDDTDNIVLQLEQPAMSNDQWPTRINFN